MKERMVVAAVLAMSMGCAESRGSRDRGAAGLFENVPTYQAPAKQRCGKHSGARKKSCDDAKYLGELYVRRLSTGDEVCLEAGFGEPSAGGCLARAAVVDTATNRILVEVRQAQPDSKWFHKEQNQFWFEEGALVDLYLADHGY
jgi:hypothetical protein